jgi:hypothetical protein
MKKHINSPQGYPRRMQRARGSAPIHPNRGHVEMRGLPERSGSGARDPPHALVQLVEVWPLRQLTPRQVQLSFILSFHLLVLFYC